MPCSRVGAACLVALLVGCSGERGGATDDVGEALVVDTPAVPAVVVQDARVGCLEIGMSVSALEAACGGVSDTTLHLEGMAQPAARVDVGRTTALAELVDGAVWRVRVGDPGLGTADFIAVGTPVSGLAGQPGIAIMHGEGTFARTDAHCGMSFRLDGLPRRSGGWTPEQLSALPDSVKVSEILVFGGCD